MVGARRSALQSVGEREARRDRVVLDWDAR